MRVEAVSGRILLLAGLALGAACGSRAPSAPTGPESWVRPQSSPVFWTIWADVRDWLGPPRWAALDTSWMEDRARADLAALSPERRYPDEFLLSGLWRLGLCREEVLAALAAREPRAEWPLTAAADRSAIAWRPRLERWLRWSPAPIRTEAFRRRLHEAWGQARLRADPELAARVVEALERHEWIGAADSLGPAAARILVDALEEIGEGPLPPGALFLLERFGVPEGVDLDGLLAGARNRERKLAGETMPLPHPYDLRLAVLRLERLREGPARPAPVPSGPPATGIFATGRVFRPDGRPAVGVLVHLAWSHEPVPPVEWPVSRRSLRATGRQVRFATPVRTDADGRYEFPRDPVGSGELDPDESDDLRVHVDDGVLVGMARAPSGASLPIGMPDLRLEEGLFLRGRVMDDTGVPVKDAEVRAIAERPTGERYLRRARSDAEGRVLFRTALPREVGVRLLVDHPRHAPTRQTPEAADVAAGRPFEVVVPRGSVLRGVVTSAEGSPRAGVQVFAARVGEKGLDLVFDRTGATDADGRFELAGLPAGALRPVLFPDLREPLVAALTTPTAEHWVLDPVRAAPGEAIDLGTIPLLPRGRISGTVRDADGRPVEDATVVAISELGPQAASGQTDAAGAFDLGEVPPGVYAVRPSMDGVDGLEAGVRVPPGERTSVDLVLPRDR